MPPVETCQTEQHDVVLKEELSGVSSKDIDVTVEHNTLPLKSTKKLPGNVRDNHWPDRADLRCVHPFVYAADQGRCRQDAC